VSGPQLLASQMRRAEALPAKPQSQQVIGPTARQARVGRQTGHPAAAAAPLRRPGRPAATPSPNRKPYGGRCSKVSPPRHPSLRRRLPTRSRRPRRRRRTSKGSRSVPAVKVVAEEAASRGGQGDEPDRQLALGGEDSRNNHHRLAGHDRQEASSAQAPRTARQVSGDACTWVSHLNTLGS
jgi:hypothetical protein